MFLVFNGTENVVLNRISSHCNGTGSSKICPHAHKLREIIVFCNTGETIVQDLNIKI